jgi:hypothetical protein
VADAETVLALAADLERRDAEAASELEQVTALSEEADRLRARGAAVRDLLAAAPAELAALDRAVAAASDRLAEAEAEVREATERLAEEGKGDRRLDAERALDLAGTLAAEARESLERLRQDAEGVRASAASARAESATLLAGAAEVAERTRRVTGVSRTGGEPPGTDLASLEEWGSRVHGALFVVRGRLEGERERLAREASELGGSVLGERLAGANVTAVRRRLEEALRR